MEMVVEMGTFRAEDKDADSNLPGIRDAVVTLTEVAADKDTDGETAKIRDVSEIRIHYKQ
jgi:hypothetical protein